MSEAKRYLWMIPKWTLPATDGARVATDRLIRNMVRAGADIDVLCLGNAGEEVDIGQMKSEWGVREVFYRPRQMPASKLGKAVFYLLKLLTRPECPLTMSTFDSRDAREFVRGITERGEYDYLFLDGLHLGACFFNGGNFEKPGNIGKVVYRAHNIEADIWTRACQETGNIFKKLALGQQAALVKKYEAEIINASDLVAPISVEDNERILRDFPDARTHVTLMGMDFSRPLGYEPGETIHFLFLGRLDWPPNRDGLRWLLDNVWNDVDKARFHLNIAGSGDKSWLKSYEGTEGVTFHGFVDDVDVLYRICHASLVPIFYGSGTRIKVVETYTKGRAMISTAMGAQGSGLIEGEDYIKAESREEWIQAINGFDLDTSKPLGESGANRLRFEFDAVKVAEQLYSKLS